jgi:DNA-binding transcriptional regulator YiaG
MSIFQEKKNNNTEIRQNIEEIGVKYYEVAAACGVSSTTFSRWLQRELPEDKKDKILDVIKGIKHGK